MQNFFAFKLSVIEKIEDLGDLYKLTFSIDSFVNSFNNTKIFITLDKKTLNLNIDYDKKLDLYFKDFINKSIQDYKYIKFSKIEFFGDNINNSNVTYTMLDKEFDSYINWEFVKELNQIEIPYSNGHKTGSYIDRNYLALVFKQYFLETDMFLKETNNSITLISLSMYLESIIQNRIINTFLYAQSLYLLNIMAVENGFNIFDKVINNYQLKINNKNIEFVISTQLNKESLLNLEIIAKIENENFVLTDTKHNLNLESILNLMSKIYNEKINVVKTKKNSSSLREIKNEFVIINNVEKKNSGFVYEPLNSLLTECKGFVFDIQKMEIEEIFSISELNNLVFEKIKQILI